MNELPLVIFDGNCGFCKTWVEYWKRLTADRVNYVPSQEVREEFPQLGAQDFARSVLLRMPDGEVLKGARAVFQLLTYAPGRKGWLWLYEHVPGFAPISEAGYRFIAGNREVFDALTRRLLGKPVLPSTYLVVEWLFLRALGVIYFTAFVSLGIQVTGLIGARGVTPIGNYLDAASRALGISSYWMVPTIFWLNHSDAFLKIVCGAGAALSLVLIIGIADRVALAGLFALYVSLSTAGQEFLSFQWDMLLLESGFLAMFLGSSRLVVWLFRWLLFRLMFLSGFVKLASHDSAWRNLTAMSFHYWTQPLPTPVAWYANQLPFLFQRMSTGMVFVVELAVPFLIFAPRKVRFFAAWWLIGLQCLILITGNYAFFNLLALALCLFLFDDRAFSKLRLAVERPRTKIPAVAAITVVVLVLSVFELSGVFFGEVPPPGGALIRLTAPFGIVNTYGLFAVMTTQRPEIIVQGSDDGVAWRDYEFQFKAGDLQRAPRWVAPYQPRLDWQMWFAALGNYQSSPWFVNFMVRLLQGAPDVLRLLANNPFPQHPPRFVRAQVFNYRFTDLELRRATGQWWQRGRGGLYLPPISLSDVRQGPLQ